MMSSKNLILIFVLSFCVVGNATAQKKKKRRTKAAAKTEKTMKAVKSETIDTAAYALGMMTALEFKKQGLKSLDPQSIAKAIMDIYEEKPLAISKEEATQIATDYRREQKGIRALKNLEEGEEFMSKNADEDGVVTMQSGLQYKILEEGDGSIPKASDHVKTHYHGTLVDGTVFDSSVERGQPATFPVGGVIKGWQEALQLMPVGSTWRVFVPSKLAYGSRGPGTIGPNSTLIFDIELLGIE